MPRTRKPYSTEFRQQMVELVRAGCETEMVDHKRRIQKKQALPLTLKSGETEKDVFARAFIEPHVQAGASIAQFVQGELGDTELIALVNALKDTTREVKDGNFDRLEETLLTQATVLGAIFSEMTERAVTNLGHYIDATEIYMKLALRAQSQCRATIESIAALKRPKAGIVQQTNIAHNQQINNKLHKENSPNELLEETDGQRLDIGEAEAPGTADSAMAPVGESNRAKDNDR